MKNISPINDEKDVVTREYADGAYLPQSGGVIAAEFGGSMANFKGLEVRRTGLTQDYAAYIKRKYNDRKPVGIFDCLDVRRRSGGYRRTFCSVGNDSGRISQQRKQRENCGRNTV